MAVPAARSTARSTGRSVTEGGDLAEAAALTVLHYDADFDHIASVTGQPTQWVVERGSID